MSAARSFPPSRLFAKSTRLLGHFDVRPLQDLLRARGDELFARDVHRQTSYGLESTQSICLRSTDITTEDRLGYYDGRSAFNEKNRDIWHLFEPYIVEMERRLRGRAIRIVVSSLAAHREVAMHSDVEWPHVWRESYLCTVRTHLPIFTNPKVKTLCEKGVLVWNEGEHWELDNIEEHAVINDSDAARINLIVDILPLANACLLRGFTRSSPEG